MGPRTSVLPFKGEIIHVSVKVNDDSDFDTGVCLVHGCLDSDLRAAVHAGCRRCRPLCRSRNAPIHNVGFSGACIGNAVTSLLDEGNRKPKALGIFPTPATRITRKALIVSYDY